MVDDDREGREPLREVVHVLEVARQHRHQIEGQSGGLHQAQPLGDVITEQPVGIGLVVDQGANADDRLIGP